MYTSANMGLTVWNLTSDLFDYTQLESNWAIVDTHTHVNGQGNQIPTGGIANGAVTSSKLASTLSLGTVTANTLTSTNKASLGNMNYGAVTITTGGGATKHGQSSAIPHGCVDASGTPVIPQSIQVTLKVDVVTAKETSSGNAMVWGVDNVTNSPNSTAFRIYVISNTDISSQTFHFYWLALS